ncbi:hypothetical protein [Fontibacillus phaseoli]|uniref:hypothetical protein n=1 Tax=Fontibacillus phaseoli TaxID=1416533 RepID=UPI000DF2E75D|nr:hypothetical protein [Fontibacillus phaseoli]
MKLIHPVGRTTKMDTQAYYGVHPMDGCICSGNAKVAQKEAKSSANPCGCYCAGDSKNKVANHSQAYIH